MLTFTKWFKVLGCRYALRNVPICNCCLSTRIRSFADTPKIDVNSKSKQGPENEEIVRVRRARPSDVPRVLRFVREHAQLTWPGLGAPPAAPQLILCDYVSRALSQGHSMLAEQQELRRGWSQIRGLALGTAVCPWDAMLLDKWSNCLRCERARRLLQFQAHCLRAPALHEKYRINNILQVMLIVPQDNPKASEIISVLAQNAIKRGREVGFQLVRFDATNDTIAHNLEQLKLNKEWQLTYDVITKEPNELDVASDNPLPENPEETKSPEENADPKINSIKGCIAVYTLNMQDTKLNTK